MTLPEARFPVEWTTQRLVSQASQHLLEEFDRQYPSAAAVASHDPGDALRLVPDVEVRWTSGASRGACELGGVYDGEANPPTITVRQSLNQKRNNFTMLHELGHHLLWKDEEWQFTVLPQLADKARLVEEKIVNDFAARILVPDASVMEHLGAGVTAPGICSLIQSAEASATTCCIRALSQAGERLVMLADGGGRIWFSDSNGTPYDPGRKVHQPSLALAAERAVETGRYQLKGGDGIRYSSGRSNTDVSIDVAISEEYIVVAVVTATRPTLKFGDNPGWNEMCEMCGSEFQFSDSIRQCAKCRDWTCPVCRACQCSTNRPVVCERCFETLSVAEKSQGLHVHEHCQ